MRKLLFTCILNAVSFFLTAQPQLKQWSLPPQKLTFSAAAITVSNLPVPTDTDLAPYGLTVDDNFSYKGIRPSYNHNIMYDENGNLLFFIVDSQIYDKDGFLISVGEGASTECVVVQLPGGCSKYLIITGIYVEGANNSII